MNKVGDYYYVYGSGCQPNRHLMFTQDEKTKQISAIAYAIVGPKRGDRAEISHISGENLFVEVASITDQTNYKKAKREGQHPDPLPDDCSLDNYADPQRLLANLEPRGPWRIMVENHINENNPRFEKPFRITFVNMS